MRVYHAYSSSTVKETPFFYQSQHTRACPCSWLRPRAQAYILPRRKAQPLDRDALRSIEGHRKQHVLDWSLKRYASMLTSIALVVSCCAACCCCCCCASSAIPSIFACSSRTVRSLDGFLYPRLSCHAALLLLLLLRFFCVYHPPLHVHDVPCVVYGFLYL